MSPSSGLESLWKCGVSSRISCGESSVRMTGDMHREPQHLPNNSRLAPPNSIHRVRSLVQGFVSPFVSCVQPSAGIRASSSQHHDLVSWQQREDASLGEGSHFDLPFSVEPRERNAFLESSPLPLNNIETCHVHCNDVLCGRGHATTHHIGNRNFRDLIASNRELYAGLSRKQKQVFVRSIVDMVHSTRPTGRFLMRDSTTGLWNDIGMTRSLEKTMQALREAGIQQSDEGVLGKEDKSVALSTASESLASASTTPASNNSQKKKHLQPISIPPHLKTIFGLSPRGIPDSVNPRSNNPPNEMSKHGVAVSVSQISYPVLSRPVASFNNHLAQTIENTPSFQGSPTRPTMSLLNTVTRGRGAGHFSKQHGEPERVTER